VSSVLFFFLIVDRAETEPSRKAPLLAGTVFSAPLMPAPPFSPEELPDSPIVLVDQFFFLYSILFMACTLLSAVREILGFVPEP